MYTKHCTNDHLVISRFKRRTCRGRIAATPAGLMMEVRSLHDHEASQARVEFAHVRERMKEMAQSSAFASAGQICHASIGSCSDEVLVILPKFHVVGFECPTSNGLWYGDSEGRQHHIWWTDPSKASQDGKLFYTFFLHVRLTDCTHCAWIKLSLYNHCL